MLAAVEDCACTLVFHRITHFGVPAMITSDRGLQFTSALWAVLCEMLDISQHQTTTHHPEAKQCVRKTATLYVQVSPRQLSLWFSSASIHSPERTLVFPLPKQTSCLLTFSTHSSSGYTAAAPFCHSNRPTTAPTPCFAAVRAPSPSESGCERRSSPPAI